MTTDELLRRADELVAAFPAYISPGDCTTVIAGLAAALREEKELFRRALSMPSDAALRDALARAERAEAQEIDVDDALSIALRDDIKGCLRERVEQLADQRDEARALLRDKVERAEAALRAAHIEAMALVTAMAEQSGAPAEWRPLPDVAGMITQISNMAAGLRERAERAEAALRALRNRMSMAPSTKSSAGINHEDVEAQKSQDIALPACVLEQRSITPSEQAMAMTDTDTYIDRAERAEAALRDHLIHTQGCPDCLDDAALRLKAERDRDDARAECEMLRGLLRDIRAHGRITGDIAVRLIAALGEGK